MKTLDGIIKGDSFTLECNIKQDITDWKIRCELYDDCGHSIKLATANITGGSNDQIEITGPSSGIFLIKIVAGETTNFDDKSQIEIEVETTTQIGGSNEKVTVFQGEIDFNAERITWDSPTD